MTTNEEDKLRKRIKNKQYVKDYRKRTTLKKMPTNEADKVRKRIKNKDYMKEYRKRKKSDQNNSGSKMKIVNNQKFSVVFLCSFKATVIQYNTIHILCYVILYNVTLITRTIHILSHVQVIK